MLSYLEKHLQVSILDLIIIAVVGGLLVNLLTYLLKHLIHNIKFFYENSILKPIQKRKKIKLYNKRLIEGDITYSELRTLRKKVDKGTATDNEIQAVILKEKEQNIFFNSPEVRKQLEEMAENFRKESNLFARRQLSDLPDIQSQHEKLVEALREINKTK